MTLDQMLDHDTIIMTDVRWINFDVDVRSDRPNLDLLLGRSYDHLLFQSLLVHGSSTKDLPKQALDASLLASTGRSVKQQVRKVTTFHLPRSACM